MHSLAWGTKRYDCSVQTRATSHLRSWLGVKGLWNLNSMGFGTVHVWPCIGPWCDTRCDTRLTYTCLVLLLKGLDFCGGDPPWLHQPACK